MNQGALAWMRHPSMISFRTGDFSLGMASSRASRRFRSFSKWRTMRREVQATFPTTPLMDDNVLYHSRLGSASGTKSRARIVRKRRLPSGEGLGDLARNTPKCRANNVRVDDPPGARRYTISAVSPLYEPVRRSGRRRISEGLFLQGKGDRIDIHIKPVTQHSVHCGEFESTCLA